LNQELIDLATALLYVLPAYVANGTPVVVTRFVKRLHPLDGGRLAWDGRRLLGDGKTAEGFASGAFTGIAVGGLLLFSSAELYRRWPEPLLLSLGALLGDLLGAFVKRRLGMERGQPAPGLDQLDFLALGLAVSFLTYGPPPWARWSIILELAALTVGLHLLTNAFAYLMRLKERPY
jgi:CDP-2,3-bis-(O-geranylgeranyl)-sn-glycerol synthase